MKKLLENWYLYVPAFIGEWYFLTFVAPKVAGRWQAYPAYNRRFQAHYNGAPK